MPAPVRILSLAGGGYLGLFTAVVLARLEARAGEPLGRRFELIAGTSVGGILAIALAFEVPMKTLVDLFLKRGQDVFSARGLPGLHEVPVIVRDVDDRVPGPDVSGFVSVLTIVVAIA